MLCVNATVVDRGVKYLQERDSVTGAVVENRDLTWSRFEMSLFVWLHSNDPVLYIEQVPSHYDSDSTDHWYMHLERTGVSNGQLVAYRVGGVCIKPPKGAKFVEENHLPVGSFGGPKLLGFAMAPYGR